jgi:hypothetical protein
VTFCPTTDDVGFAAIEVVVVAAEMVSANGPEVDPL